MGLVMPLGVAMTGRVVFAWVTSGAVIWTCLFGYAAAKTGRSPLAWGLVGGFICGTIWAQAEFVSDRLILLGVGAWSLLAVLAIGAGLGSGALLGASMGRGHDAASERRQQFAAAFMGAALGVAGGFVASLDAAPSRVAMFAAIGGASGCLAAWPGRALGVWFRPSVLFFDQLWPYLREMAIPLGAFSVGYFCLTLIFAGFYGTLWHADRAAFEGFPRNAQFWDFVYFSLMTASTANTDVLARSQLAQILVSVEVIVGLGWMLVVFGALSAHLSPRLEAIANALHRSGRSTS
jgi:hypothetical protein